MDVVAFTLGGDRFALPIARVREVIRHSTPRPVGSPLPFVAGVIELRGRLIPVCDVAARVGARAAPGAARRILVVDMPGGPAGVLVDTVDRVLAVPDADLAALPPEVATDLVSGVAQVGGALVPVLDPDRLLAGVVRAAGRAARARGQAARAAQAPRQARRAQPSRKRSEKATRSTGGADTGSPSSVTS